MPNALAELDPHAAADELQAELFPHNSPATVCAYGIRLSRRIAHLADTMTGDQATRVLGELALVELQLDKIEQVRHWSGRAAPVELVRPHLGAVPKVYAEPWGFTPAPWPRAARRALAS